MLLLLLCLLLTLCCSSCLGSFLLLPSFLFLTLLLFRCLCDGGLDLCFLCIQFRILLFQRADICIQRFLLPFHLLLRIAGFRVGILQIHQRCGELVLLCLLVRLLFAQALLLLFQLCLLFVAGFQLVLQGVDQIVVVICHTGHQLILREQVVKIGCANQRRCQTVIALYVHCTQTHFELVQTNGDIRFHDGDIILSLCNGVLCFGNGCSDSLQLLRNDVQIFLLQCDLFFQRLLVLFILVHVGLQRVQFFLLLCDL